MTTRPSYALSRADEYVKERERRERQLDDARRKVHLDLANEGQDPAQAGSFASVTDGTSYAYAADAQGFETIWRALGASSGWPSDALPGIIKDEEARRCCLKYGQALDMVGLVKTVKSVQFSAFREDCDFLSVLASEFRAFRVLEAEIARQLVKDMRMRLSMQSLDVIKGAHDERVSQYDEGFSEADLDAVMADAAGRK